MRRTKFAFRFGKGDELSGQRRGFALITVIWGLGVISLLVTSFMSDGRLRLQTASNIAGAMQAGLIAEGALNAATLSLLSETAAVSAQTDRPTHDGSPRFCSLAEAAVALSVEDEGGKVDINTASQKLLQALLMGFGVEMRRADTVANAIVAFRSKPPNDFTQGPLSGGGSDGAPPPAGAPFHTILELDQVGGIDSALFRDLVPFVTVYSRSQGVDPRAAPPALFSALAGFPHDDVQILIATPFPNALDRSDPRFPREFNQASDHGAFLMHSEALLPGGQFAVREMSVDLRANGVSPFVVKEIRRGAVRHIDQLRSIMRAGAVLPEC